MRPLRYATLWLVAGWVLIVGAIAASLWPDAHTLRAMHLDDKVAHVGAYFVLMTWFAGIYAPRRYPLVAVLLLLLGAMLELLQAQLSHRVAEPADLVADGIGIALGCAAALLGLGGWCARLESLLLSDRSP